MQTQILSFLLLDFFNYKLLLKSDGIGGGTISPGTSRCEVRFKLLFPVRPKMELFVHTNHINTGFGYFVFAGIEAGFRPVDRRSSQRF